MISAVNQSPAFKGVVPVRVFIDGLETFDEKLIKSSCRQLSNVLAGPSNTEPKLSMIRLFGKFDKDYSVENGFYGFPKQEHHQNIRPSEFFRCLFERGRAFFVTGPQAEKLHELGKAIGCERAVCNERKVQNSFDLKTAKRIYGRTVEKFLSNTRIRMSQVIDNKITPLTLIINMRSNEKYGLSTFKMKLSDINFTTSLQ